MHVTFFRLPAHQRGWSLVERDDGVAYRMDGTPGSDELPHDLVHFAVERALRIPDGIWGAVAAGVVFRSMHHHAGRRPPHGAQRSAALIRANRHHLHRAELIGGLVERIAALPAPTRDDIARLARESLATLPDGIELGPLPGAAAELREAAEGWRRLRVGDHVRLDWPVRLRMPAAPSGQAGHRDGHGRADRRRMAAARA
jgi:hypothetical protein